MRNMFSCVTCDHFGECTYLPYCGGYSWQPKRRDDESTEDQDEEEQ